MGFEPIKRVLPKAVEQAGIKRQLDAVRILETARELLARLWGDERASFIVFLSCSDGTLKAESRSGAAVQELKLIETKFLNDLNRQLEMRAVRSLNVRIA